MKPRARVVDVRPASETDQVLTVMGGSRESYRREPCGGCPWRKDQTGEFSAEAFVHSARTAYDMSTHTFACHESGADKPAICAGFLLRGSAHNMVVRMRLICGEIQLDVSDSGHALHHDYVAMAVANGVKPSHPALARCRRNRSNTDE